MTAGPDELIVHQYNAEPAFSITTRLMLGFKNAEWFAYDRPTILPRPELAAPTGGYRQIPVARGVPTSIAAATCCSIVHHAGSSVHTRPVWSVPD